jgi:hypothetical protein
MKQFFCKVWCILQSLGYARAASELARAGRYAEAKNLTMQEKSCKC